MCKNNICKRILAFIGCREENFIQNISLCFRQQLVWLSLAYSNAIIWVNIVQIEIQFERTAINTGPLSTGVIKKHQLIGEWPRTVKCYRSRYPQFSRNNHQIFQGSGYWSICTWITLHCSSAVVSMPKCCAESMNGTRKMGLTTHSTIFFKSEVLLYEDTKNSSTAYVVIYRMVIFWVLD